MNPILVLEDDEMLNGGLCFNLIAEGYSTISTKTVAQARAEFTAHECSLLILDINLPDGSGIDFGRWVRESSNVPIIFLTARDLDEEIIEGFQAGADDYMTKPFNIRVLLKRVEAILRRAKPEPEKSSHFSCGNLEIDFDSHIVKKSGSVLTLTPTEYRLLNKFCANKEIVLTRQVLLEDLWDQYGNFVDEHTLTINISRLRSKISDAQYTYIKTIYGSGYQWVGEKQ